MIRTLRSLCLLKVERDEVNYEGLPPGLVKDLKVMKLFNGNYGFESSCKVDGQKILDLFALSILYDGATWSMASRGRSIHMICCYHCSAWQPQLFKLEITEGELVTAVPPFSQVRDWFGKDVENEYKQLDMDIVVNVGQDLMSGKLKFHGTGDLVSFEVLVQVELSAAGSRVMVQSGKAESGSVTMGFNITLHETIVPAQDAFAVYEPVHDEEEEEENEIDETEEEDDDEYDWEEEEDEDNEVDVTGGGGEKHDGEEEKDNEIDETEEEYIDEYDGEEEEDEANKIDVTGGEDEEYDWAKEEENEIDETEGEDYDG